MHPRILVLGFCRFRPRTSRSTQAVLLSQKGGLLLVPTISTLPCLTTTRLLFLLTQTTQKGGDAELLYVFSFEPLRCVRTPKKVFVATLFFNEAVIC